MSIGGLEERVIKVCHGWGLYDDENATDFTRFDKLEEEVAELEDALFATGTLTQIQMEAGDVIVTLINILYKKGLNLESCLNAAYMKIKDRKGKMINGSYVKEEDL
jgi:NTP pyrophosphatase (non-canonical NTP hydrolase)